MSNLYRYLYLCVSSKISLIRFKFMVRYFENNYNHWFSYRKYIQVSFFFYFFFFFKFEIDWNFIWVLYVSFRLYHNLIRNKWTSVDWNDGRKKKGNTKIKNNGTKIEEEPLNNHHHANDPPRKPRWRVCTSVSSIQMTWGCYRVKQTGLLPGAQYLDCDHTCVVAWHV